jgi:hypothetical protein
MQSGGELMQKLWGELDAEITLKPVSMAEISTAVLAGEVKWLPL